MANVGPGTLTITSSTGPGQTVTATVLSRVTNISVNLTGNAIRVMYNDGTGLQYFDYSAVTTVTWSISAGATSVTIS